MAHHSEKSIKANIPAEKVWQVLEDYNGIDKFAMTIKSSSSANDISIGVGLKENVSLMMGQFSGRNY